LLAPPPRISLKYAPVCERALLPDEDTLWSWRRVLHLDDAHGAVGCPMFGGEALRLHHGARVAALRHGGHGVVTDPGGGDGGEEAEVEAVAAVDVMVGGGVHAHRPPAVVQLTVEGPGALAGDDQWGASVCNVAEVRLILVAPELVSSEGVSLVHSEAVFVQIKWGTSEPDWGSLVVKGAGELATVLDTVHPGHEAAGALIVVRLAVVEPQSGLAGAGDDVVEVDGPEVGLVVDQVHVGIPAGSVVVAAGEAGAAFGGGDGLLVGGGGQGGPYKGGQQEEAAGHAGGGASSRQ